MAEQLPPVETSTAPVVDPIKAELAEQMAISLNGGIPPQAAAEPAPGAAAPAAAAPATTTDPFGIFKEKFGYDSPEVAIQDIEALRLLRASPPVAELKFENEESKRLAEAINAGNLKEVHEVLDRRLKIDHLTAGEMTADTAADIIKLGMQLKYKDLTPAQINYKFNKQYGAPPKPGLLPTEDQEEYTERLAAWQAQFDDKQMELMIDAQIAKPELLATKSKLVIPAIQRPEEQGFLDWQKLNQENERLAAETTQAYKAFTPKSLETKINFKDEANKIDFDFIFEPDPDSFKQAQDMTFDINNFWKHFIKPDGTPDRKEFLETIWFGMNRQKVILEALNQSKNATIKASLPDNSTGGLVRQLPQTQEPNELDKLMRASLKGYGGF
jgi:hypothetical protein